MGETDHEARKVFTAAFALSTPEERARYLDEACRDKPELRQRVEGLLRAHDKAGGFLEQTVPVPPPEDDFATERPGVIIGRYKLLQEIGEGGFGRVFMAEQKEPVQRKVALKIIKAGMDTKEVVARFEAERQALALMDHPSIAQVFDGGATQAGRPYFVMELVKGIPVTDYCDRHKLPMAERLRLFMQVCQAVQHAHQKGIIHRDLKPSNILITMIDGKPVPKIIDFGVAKALGQQLTEKTLFTAFQQVVGTPLFMSPEQTAISGVDVDTRSDVYSLGVLLYELLTGSTPIDAETVRKAGLDEVRRMIRETDPPMPSTRLRTLGDKLTEVAQHRHVEPSVLTRMVHGDLDWIVMKALEKDRGRRYETVNALLADVQRHLEHQPVLAGPPGMAYRAKKYVRRHRMGVALAASVTVALIAGLVASLIGFAEARRERDRALTAEQQAEQERDRAREAEAQAEQNRQQAEAEREKAQTEATRSTQVARFMKDMLEGVGPSVALGRDVQLLREILDQTSQRLSVELTNQPDVKADLCETLGMVYRDLSDYSKAEAMLQEALALEQQIHGEEHRDAARLHYELALVHRQQGRQAECETGFRRALAIQRKLFGEDSPEVATSLAAIGEALRMDPRNFTEAESCHRHALAIRRKLFGNDHPDVATSLNNLGITLTRMPGRQTEAESCIREALKIQRQFFGTGHPRVADSLMQLGAVLARIPGRQAEAEATLREALVMQQKLLGEHRSTALCMVFLAFALLNEDKSAEAESLAREAQRMQKRVLGEHWDQSVALTALGMALEQQGNLPEAEAAFREAWQNWSRQLGPDHPYAVGEFANLTRNLRHQGKIEELATLLRETVSDVHKPALLNAIAWSLATDTDASCRDGQSAVKFAEKAVAATGRTNAMYLDTLAAAYAEAGQFTNAVHAQKEAIGLLEDPKETEDYESRLRLFESNTPYRD